MPLCNALLNRLLLIISHVLFVCLFVLSGTKQMCKNTGPFREEAAYVIDRSYGSFSGVPVTKTVMVRKGGQTPAPSVGARKRFVANPDANASANGGVQRLENLRQDALAYPLPPTATPEKRQNHGASTAFNGGKGNGNGSRIRTPKTKSRPVILQRFLEGLSNCEDHNLNLLLRDLPPLEIHKVAVFDIRFFNTDRHGGNLMVTEPRAQDAGPRTNLIPIDHAYCLPDFLHLGAPKYEWLECAQVPYGLCICAFVHLCICALFYFCAFVHLSICAFEHLSI